MINECQIDLIFINYKTCDIAKPWRRS